jgi:hypothetical protein
MFLPLLLAIQLTPSGPAERYTQPQIASHRDVVGVTFGSGTTVYYSGSRDRGKTFSTPMKVVQSSTKISLGMHRGPRIAITPAAIVISAVVQDKDGHNGDLLAWRSTDGGKTWSEGVVVNDYPTAAREGLHGVAAGENGMLYAAWLDDRSIETSPRRKKLFGASSQDGGKTWSKNTLIYRSPEGPDAKICECCHPSVAIDSHGRIYVMFRNNLAGARDMYLAHSDDGGSTFSQAQKVGEGTWPINACPMDGGGVSIGRDGNVISVWRRQDTIYMNRDGQREVIVAKGKNPAIAAGKDGAYLAWSSPSGLMAQIPGSREPIALADDGGYPSLVAVGSSVLAAWESNGKVVIRDLTAEQQSARRGD